MKSSSDAKPGHKKPSRTPWVLLAVGLPVLLLGGWGVSSLFSDAAVAAGSDAATFVVKRGPLRVSVVEKGSLKAVVSQDLQSQIEGQSTILRIVQEGESVKKGDVVVELDASSLEEKRAQQEITLAKAEADFVAARENFEIQKNANASAIATAAQQVDFAKMDQKKFAFGDKKAELEESEAKIKLAEQEVSRAKDKVDWSEKLAKDGYISRLELESDKLAHNKAELDLQIAITARDVLTNQEYGTQAKTELELQRKYEEAVDELERERRTAIANEAQANSNLKAKEATYNLEKQRYEKMIDQIAKAKMRAPSDGIVVYASTSDDRGRSDQRPIEEGATVRERQLILSLPDVSRMKAIAKIHESVFDKVKVGQPVIITLDAFGDRTWAGEVSKVAIIPDSQSSWLNPDLKVYSTEILLDGETTELRPGMSSSCEIIVSDLENAVQVPVQAVHRRAGKYVVFARGAAGAIEERAIEPGVTNERMVEVKSGLEEGEVVFLQPPTEALQGVERETGLEGEAGGRQMPPRDPNRPRAGTGEESGEPEVRGNGGGFRDRTGGARPGGGGPGSGGLVPEGMGADFFERMRRNELTDDEKAKFEEMRKQRGSGADGAGERRGRGGDGENGSGDGGGRRRRGGEGQPAGQPDSAASGAPPAPVEKP